MVLLRSLQWLGLRLSFAQRGKLPLRHYFSTFQSIQYSRPLPFLLTGLGGEDGFSTLWRNLEHEILAKRSQYWVKLKEDEGFLNTLDRLARKQIHK